MMPVGVGTGFEVGAEPVGTVRTFTQDRNAWPTEIDRTPR